MLPSKLIEEVITVSYCFLEQLAIGETISTAVFTATVFSSIDAVPQQILLGTATISGGTVTQQVQQGLAGVVYSLACVVTTSLGNSVEIVKRLAVLSSEGASFAPGSYVTLTGALPDGTTGTAYSSNLDIRHGYQPYRFEGIVAGIAPGWMGFTVVDNELVCAGMPNETAAVTEYIFTPKVFDAANNSAVDPQDIIIRRATVEQWWITRSRTDSNAIARQLWRSYDLVNWVEQDRSPYLVQADFGVTSVEGGRAIIAGTGNAIELITNLDPPITPTMVSIGGSSNIVLMKTFQNTTAIPTICCIDGGTNQVQISTDRGASFSFMPQGSFIRIYGLDRLSNGRWMLTCHLNAGSFFYSDELVPSTGWIHAGSDAIVGDVMGPITSNGSVAVALNNAGDIYRTLNGGYWSKITTPISGAGTGDRRCGLAIGNTLLVGYGQGGKILRSTDAGISWASVTIEPASVNAVAKLDILGTTIVASLTGNTLYKSVDDGATWALISLPFVPGTSSGEQVRCGHVSLLV